MTPLTLKSMRIPLFFFLLFYFDILDHALRRMTPLRDRASPVQVNTSLLKACWVGVKIRQIRWLS